jgi:hypothetical protein
MAESDPDSNSLRQDQPECPEHNARGVLGGNTRVCSPIGFAFVTPRTEPGVTELSGLTSDSVLTADRRGGILISFGPHRTPLKGINPSKRRPHERADLAHRRSGVETELNGLRVSLSFRIPSESPVPLKGVGLPFGQSFPTDLRIPFKSRLTDKPIVTDAVCAPFTPFSCVAITSVFRPRA